MFFAFANREKTLQHSFFGIRESRIRIGFAKTFDAQSSLGPGICGHPPANLEPIYGYPPANFLPANFHNLQVPPARFLNFRAPSRKFRANLRVPSRKFSSRKFSQFAGTLQQNFSICGHPRANLEPICGHPPPNYMGIDQICEPRTVTSSK